jgi:phospholipid/cholesterol/gamma-HCH transport system substrate-binding protein
MKKGLIAAAVVAAVVVVALLAAGDDDSVDGYHVRAVFDSSGFIVPGGEVRIAGAEAGVIESVDVTMPDELVSFKDGRWREAPGKALLVLKIEDEGFTDFRRDANCAIRPQSLIGEKFVDCRPTLPRAPGSPPPPPLKEVPEGEPGAGQHLLPLEQNSTSVDPDLINNIQRLPYAQRFRLILNELGATFAGRGEELEEVVERANPVLRDATRLFELLEVQRDQLAQLAADGEQILEPLSRERASVAGFFSNSGAAAEATTERGEELESALAKLPTFLREFRDTLGSLEGFSDAATPVFTNLSQATPAFTNATRALTPFSAASTVSLKSLGETGQEAGPTFRAADPVVRKARNLAKSGVRPTNELARFLASTRRTGGFGGLVDLIYNGTGTTNEYDQYGHFTRSLAVIQDCFDYLMSAKSGCVSNFTGFGSREEEAGASSLDVAGMLERFEEEAEELGGGTEAGEIAPPPLPSIEDARPSTPRRGPGSSPAPKSGPSLDDSENLGASAMPSPSQRALLDYLLGP